MLSAARSRANASACAALANRSAKSGKRALIGARAVRRSSLPLRCARVLDQRPACARARKARAHRLERHGGERRREVVLVHHHGAEAALPEMAAAFAPRVNEAGVTPVDGRQRAAQGVAVAAHQDEMHMVRHQAPGPHCNGGRATVLAEEIAVERVIGVAEEDAGATVAALGDVMRQAGNDDASKAGHAGI